MIKKNMPENSLSETKIYLVLKKWLQEHGWLILGGEPPGGTNVIPVIELKDVEYKNKGSMGSKKIDLVCYKKDYFLLIELKENYSCSDIKKLNEIVGEEKWRKAFVRALKEKQAPFISKLFFSLKESEYIEKEDFYIKAVGFNDSKASSCPSDFAVFIPIKTGKIKIIFGLDISISKQQLFTF